MGACPRPRRPCPPTPTSTRSSPRCSRTGDAATRRARTLFERVTGERAVLWGPSILGFGSAHYRYASGREGDWPPVAFSPRKTALTLYLMDGLEPHADDLARLGPHSTGTGCLYLKDLDAVDESALESILARSWQSRGTNPRA